MSIKLHKIGYRAAWLLTVLAIIGSELIWLPGAWRMKNGTQWIDIIDVLYQGLLIIPLLLLLGLSASVATMLNNRKYNIRSLSLGGKATAALQQLLQLLIVVSAGWSLYLFAMRTKELLLVFGLLAVSLILSILECLLAELLEHMIQRSSYTVYGNRQGFGSGASRKSTPKSSLRWLVGLLLVAMLFLLPTGYKVTYPAMTLDMNRYAAVAGGSSHSHSVIDGVLVFDRVAVPADFVYGWFFPQYEFEPVPKNEPSIAAQVQQNVVMKLTADQVATAIALQHVGLGNGVTSRGVQVLQVQPEAPAIGLVEVGDVITRLGNEKITSVTEMLEYMGNIRAGDAIDAELERAGERLAVQIPTYAATDDSRAIMGISVQTAWEIDNSREVTYKDYLIHVGGPSHGAMLTLALIDQLSPDGIIGDLRVAGTGTIQPDGSVGMVGGIAQKAYAVSRTGADVFFVPYAGEAAAKAAAPALNIVGVDSINDILAWVKAHH